LFFVQDSNKTVMETVFNCFTNKINLGQLVFYFNKRNAGVINPQ